MSTTKKSAIETPRRVDGMSKSTSIPIEIDRRPQDDSPSIHSQDFGALVDNVVKIEVDLRKQQELERLGRVASQD